MSAHYLRPWASVRAPSVLVSAVADTTEVDPPGWTPEDERRALSARAAGDGAPAIRRSRAADRECPRRTVLRSLTLAGSARRRTAWPPAWARSWACGASALEWLHQWAPAHRAVWIVTPQPSEILTYMGFWRLCDELGAVWVGRGPDADTPRRVDPSDPRLHFTALAVSGQPEIVKYRIGTKSFVWVATTNYFHAREEEVFRCAGLSSTCTSTTDCTTSYQPLSAESRSLAWLTVFRRLCDWWREVRGGTWGTTAASLGMSYCMHRVPARTILVHQNIDAHAVENRALWAGRTSTWYYGDIGSYRRYDWEYSGRPPRSQYGYTPGPVYHWDVRSMYPTLLSTQRFPVRLLSVHREMSLSALEEALRDYGVIASVWLRTETPEYPYRDKDAVSQPVGFFPTVICGPELQQALRAGELASVGATCIYTLGRPFASSMSELLKLRKRYSDPDSIAMEMFVKLLSNSVTGKFAQRKHHLVPRPDVPALVDWGSWSCDRGNGRGVAQYFAVARMVWERVQDEDAGRDMAPIYAYLTSYGRVLMASVRASLPARTVVSQDTDGIWSLSRSTPRIPQLTGVWSPTLAQIRLVGESPVARWYSPKHYYTRSGWVLSGLCGPQRSSDGLTFRDSYTKRQVFGATEAPTEWASYVERESTLSLLPKDGRVGPDGWQIPKRI